MKVNVKLGNPFRKKRFLGQLSEKRMEEKKRLVERRKERTREVKSQGLK